MPARLNQDQRAGCIVRSIKQLSEHSMNISQARTACKIAAFLCFAALPFASTLKAQEAKKPAPAAKPAAKPAVSTTAKSPASATASHAVTTGTASHAAPTAAGARPVTTAHPMTAAHPMAAAHPMVAHGGALGHPGPIGSHDRVAPNGSVVRMRADGHPMDVHDARRGMDIHHNLGGGRLVVMDRPDHSRLYFEHGRPGYIAHPYLFHGHDYYRRSYYFNGHAYDRFYNHYAYRGIYLDVYAPAHYYGVGFYGWAYHPWARPVPYAWGFAAAPWHRHYGAYFVPYPVYDRPSLWLTDYLISTSLAAAYEAHAAAQAQAEAAGAAPMAPLTPEAKELVANEIQGEIALENAEAQTNVQGGEIQAASSSIARVLSDGRPHVFVAGKELDLVDSYGQECAVTDGDVLQLTAPPAPDATSANLVVLASKGGIECRNQSMVSVSLADLQEMYNYMRETLDQGLQELQTNQGQGGLPAAPPSATVPPATAAIAENAPPPDPAGAQELAQQAKEADSAEQEVMSQASAGAAAPAEAGAAPAAAVQPATLSLGQTTDDVTAAIGQPTRILNLGTKTIYVYKDMKVTFKAGKVSDIE